MEVSSKWPFDTSEALITNYSPTVYRLALSYTGNQYDAEDVMQEVFYRYVKRKPDFVSKEHEKAWFLRVTINCSKSFFSSFWRRNTVSMEHAPNQYTNDSFHKSENTVYEAVMALPVKQRLCIHLFYYEELSIKEIALYTGFNESTVKSHMFRAKKTLGQQLKGVEINVE